MIVAIDGGVATGKSAAGRRVAQALSMRFVDTGLMYRAIAVMANREGVDVGDGAALTRLAGRTAIRVDGRQVWAGDEELTASVYAADVSGVVSLVAKVAGVRVALVAQQRALGRGGVVMAGRDIGTVVFPDADFKFFLTASIAERVRRRAVQMAERGEAVDEAAMMAEVQERDRLDSERSVAPLRAAEDAVLVDTDQLSLDGVVELILNTVRGPD